MAATAASSLGSTSAGSSPVADLAAAPPAVTAAPDLQHAQSLIDQVTKSKDLQTSFVPATKVDFENLAAWRRFWQAVGRFFEAVGDLFAPLAPAMPYILFLLAVALVLLLLSPVVRLFITTRFERLFARDLPEKGTPWRPSKAAVTALLHDIDALAGQGQYDEAVHLLLMRSVADINSFRPDLVRVHFSSRDISTHPLMPDAARPAFREIVGWVEKSFFAGQPVGKEGFDACRAAYVAFIAAEGIA